ncbi:hypothetical protein GCM10010129_84700 [Streptomyces fumigatiscleroticus]|nr:hypothetical protein GCM10010129_84700 [Streptomyces fumigatiscleroticus]
MKPKKNTRMKPKKNTRVKPKKNTRMEQIQLLSFTNKIKRIIRNSSFFRNNSFLKKFYNSVIVRTCYNFVIKREELYGTNI